MLARIKAITPTSAEIGTLERFVAGSLQAMESSVLKVAIKQIALKLFPDAALKFLSIRSRRQIERQVHKLGLDTVARQISRENDGRIASGPFRGMRLDSAAFPVHVFVPKLLGTYEQELYPALERAIERSPSHVLNVGCAEGFYAVGMAMRLPHAMIYASDADPKAVRATIQNAELNGVAKQVVPIGIIHPGEFDRYLTPHRSLLIMDCEGAEFSLLNPQTDPVLSSVDMIVEVHPEVGLSEEIWRRFEKTHRCERLDYIPRRGIAEERRGERGQQWLVLTRLPACEQRWAP
jgi:ribosomal protein L11 methyltransferase PrmA